MGMSVLIVIVLAGIAGSLVSGWNKKQAEKQKEAAMKDSKIEGARKFFLETLKKLGCPYEIDKEDGGISFQWQGGYFRVEAADDSPFVVVWYPGWGRFDLSDVDTLSRVRKVINLVNIERNIKVFYTIEENEGTFSIHAKKHLLFISQIPDAEGYLNAVLSAFFDVRRDVESELDKQKNAEERAGLR